LTSLAGDVATFARTVRGFCGIENGQHWILAVAFREDDSRIQTRHSAENVAVLRRIALNLMRQERSVKAGVKAKRLTAGWDEAYLLRLLAQQDAYALASTGPYRIRRYHGILSRGLVDTTYLTGICGDAQPHLAAQVATT
jgi:hypothetical protein